MVRPVGIDLGTTNSVIAYCAHTGAASVIRNANGETVTPSVIAFGAAGPVVGIQAAQTYGFGLTPGAALFKRQMGRTGVFVTHAGVDYSPEELSAMVLGSLADDATAELGARPARAVITVPAYFQNAEREATMRAAHLAGLQCLQLINEPTAAAITFNMDNQDASGRILVYDLGGGTFDVSVLETGDLSRVIDTRGDPQLGGADWDQVLVEMFATRLVDSFDPDELDDPALVQMLRREAELTKKRLSSMARVQVLLMHEGKAAQFEVTRADFDAAAEGLVQSTLDMTEEVLRAIGVTHRGIDDVLLVGGATRMPMIETALTERFGRPPRKTINPDEAVALGAALRADYLEQASSADRGLAAMLRPAGETGIAAINDITNFSLGVIAVSEDGGDYVNRVMIERGSRLPAEGIQPFRHVFRSGGGTQLELFVTQGEGYDPKDVRYLGLYTLDTLPGAVDGRPCEIEIGFGYDASGIGSAKARLASGGSWVPMARSQVGDDVPERFAEPPPRATPTQRVSIMMVFDVSGSMTGSPIDDARAAAREFVAQFDPGMVDIGIGVVADKSRVLLPPSRDYVEVERTIDRIDTNAGNVGYGNAEHPFEDLSKVLGPRDGPRTAVVLADGVWEDQPRAVKSARDCHAQDIEIVAIGFGHADKRFLDEISTAAELSLKVEQSQLVATFGSIAQVVAERSGMVRK